MTGTSIIPAYIGTGGGGGMKPPPGGIIGVPTGGGRCSGLSGRCWLNRVVVGGFDGIESASGVESNTNKC